jgi:hypothetical protein
MDAQFIQLLRNPNFILHGEGDVFRLGAIAERGIIDFH